MKAEELMTGDWMCVGKDGLCIPKDTIVKIRAIDELNSLVLRSGKKLTGSVHCQPAKDAFFSGGIWVDYLEPIPLTAEILEKNGFEELMNEGEACAARFGRTPKPTGVWQYGFGQFDSVSYVPKRNFLRIKFMEGCTADIDDIKYVHELQHALRLFKVNKEIEL